jgi:predicted nucleic acid-binding protein
MLGNAPGSRDPEGIRDTNMIVVDTNVICYRWISSPNSTAAETTLAKDPHWIAPVLWRSEFRNVLAVAIRQKALTIDAAREIARNAETSFERREFTVSSDAVFQLVATSNCTAYGCEFVALAEVHQVPLVTVDRRVLHEFPRIAVSLERFVAE